MKNAKKGNTRQYFFKNSRGNMCFLSYNAGHPTHVKTIKFVVAQIKVFKTDDYDNTKYYTANIQSSSNLNLKFDWDQAFFSTILEKFEDFKLQDFTIAQEQFFQDNQKKNKKQGLWLFIKALIKKQKVQIKRVTQLVQKQSQGNYVKINQDRLQISKQQGYKQQQQGQEYQQQRQKQHSLQQKQQQQYQQQKLSQQVNNNQQQHSERVDREERVEREQIEDAKEEHINRNDKVSTLTEQRPSLPFEVDQEVIVIEQKQEILVQCKLNQQFSKNPLKELWTCFEIYNQYKTKAIEAARNKRQQLRDEKQDKINQLMVKSEENETIMAQLQKNLQLLLDDKIRKLNTLGQNFQFEPIFQSIIMDQEKPQQQMQMEMEMMPLNSTLFQPSQNFYM